MAALRVHGVQRRAFRPARRTSTGSTGIRLRPAAVFQAARGRQSGRPGRPGVRQLRPEFRWSRHAGGDLRQAPSGVFAVVDKNKDGVITGFEQTDWAALMGGGADVLANAMTFDMDLDRAVSKDGVHRWAEAPRRPDPAAQAISPSPTSCSPLTVSRKRLTIRAGFGWGKVTPRGSPPERQPQLAGLFLLVELSSDQVAHGVERLVRIGRPPHQSRPSARKRAPSISEVHDRGGAGAHAVIAHSHFGVVFRGLRAKRLRRAHADRAGSRARAADRPTVIG